MQYKCSTKLLADRGEKKKNEKDCKHSNGSLYDAGIDSMRW